MCSVGLGNTREFSDKLSSAIVLGLKKLSELRAHQII